MADMANCNQNELRLPKANKRLDTPPNSPTIPSTTQDFIRYLFRCQLWTFKFFYSRSIQMQNPSRLEILTTLPIRMHLDQEGSLETEWNHFKTGWSTFGNCKKLGSLSPLANPAIGNWIALVLPEADPSRLGLMSYLANFVFLIDDYIERLPHEKAKASLLDIVSAFDPKSTAKEENSDIKCFIRKMAIRILKQDNVLGPELLEAWKEYYKFLSIDKSNGITEMQQYLEFRCVDFGCYAWLAMIRYAYKLHLTPDTLKILDKLTTEAMVTSALMNDYYSYRKERAAAGESTCALINAVDVILRTTPGTTEESALARTGKLAEEHEAAFLKGYDNDVLLVSVFQTSGFHEAKATRYYLRAVAWFVSGNCAWSATSPRYNTFT